MNWDAGTELYFNDNKTPFVGENQNFLIVFGIEGQEKLPDNKFSNNQIFIPEDGILLTSSKTDIYRHRYQFIKKGSGNKFITSHFEQYDCYGKRNHKFKYLIGSINDSGTIDYIYKDSILDCICDKLNRKEIRSYLKSGYKNGSYLDQKEIIINNENLISIPDGVSELKNLEYINIHSNNFQTIPSEIYQFSRLKKLSIGNNSIRYIPEQIGSLTTLESLAVNRNNLTELPDTILKLPKLKYLSVRGNNFSSQTKLNLKRKYERKEIELQFE